MAHPEGTKAWRKSHRRKWRDGSSYRSLNLLQREILRWVEDNADDQGRTPPTGQHYLAKLLSSAREVISRDQIQRAVVGLEKSGLVLREPHSVPHKDPHKEPHKIATVYVRANFAEYQTNESEPHKDPHKVSGGEPRLGGRRGRSGRETTEGAEAPPAAGWQALIATLTTAWQGRYPGTQLVWAGRDFKALKTLLGSIPEAEIVRRFSNYLTNPDPFYAGHPVTTFCSQVNRFVAAPVRAAGFAVAESHESFAARGGGTQSW